MGNKFLQTLFSIKNHNQRKVLTFFGLKFKFKKTASINALEKAIEKQQEEIIRLKKLTSFLNVKVINKEKISSEMENIAYYGIKPKNEQTPPGIPRLIVSLTSFPDRMYDIHYCLYSLLNQSLKPDEIVLYLGIEQFPNGEKDVYRKVLDLKEKGLTIKFTEDTRSYKKLLPALSDYPNDIIVTADDDCFYPNNWLSLLYDSYLEDKTCVHCHRAHKMLFDENKNLISYNNWEKGLDSCEASIHNFATGVGGVLYPPNILHKDILKKEIYQKLTPTNDDIWFWAMTVLGGAKVKVVKNNIKDLTYINARRETGYSDEMTLAQSNVLKSENDIQLKNILGHYPEIKNFI